MKIIETNNALKPAGHYAQAITHNGLVYVSGQLAVDSETGEKVFETPSQQMMVILKNLELILVEANSKINQILKVTVYLSDISYWDDINDVYSQFFGEHKPARVIVPTGPLHFGLSVEVDCIAYI